MLTILTCTHLRGIDTQRYKPLRVQQGQFNDLREIVVVSRIHVAQ
jgi:hypothetical protein